MKKKFKFKLEGLLKLKSFNESKLRTELGSIVKEMEAVKSNIEGMRDDIKQSYVEQERVMESTTSGQLLQFFPYFIKAKKEDIKTKENLLYALEKRYQNKLVELSDAMGEVKMVTNLKEKKKDEHRKAIDKKINEESEELFISRRQFLRNLES